VNLTNNEQLPNLPEYNEKILLAMEKEMVGVYLSGHPLSEYEKELEKIATTNTSEIAEIRESEEAIQISENSRVVIGGIIIKKQNKITKNNNMMAFITLEDLYGTVEGIVFPKIYDKYKDFLYEDNIILVEGILDISEEEAPKLICNKITELKKEAITKEINAQNKKLYLKVENTEQYKSVKKEIFKNINQYRGNNCVIIYNQQDKTNIVLPMNNWVNIDSKDLIKNLIEVLGENNIAIRGEIL